MYAQPMAGEARPSAAYYIALGLLAVGLVAGLSLFLLLATRPHSTTASVEVGTAVGADCPVGSHATSCYRFTVTNKGKDPAVATCEVSSAPGTTAQFGEGTAITTVTLLEGQTKELSVSVVVAGQSDTLAAPQVSCPGSSV